MINGLNSVTLLLVLFMIYFVGHWLYKEIERRRDWESEAELERAEIKAIAEKAARDAAAGTEILQQFPAVQQKRRLNSVRDNRR